MKWIAASIAALAIAIVVAALIVSSGDKNCPKQTYNFGSTKC
jgi:hypothetical protein